MNEVYEFLKKAGTYYLATVDGNKPRVRPFGSLVFYEDKLYIQTSRRKEVAKQIAANPNVEICAMLDGRWMRVSGELVNDDRREVKELVLEQFPELRKMYTADDPNTQVFYFRNAVATVYSFTEAPREIEL